MFTRQTHRRSSRKVNLEQSDGLCEAQEPEDKLREVLRRSASGRAPDTFGSEGETSFTSDHQFGLESYRQRQRGAVIPQCTRTADSIFRPQASLQDCKLDFTPGSSRLEIPKILPGRKCTRRRSDVDSFAGEQGPKAESVDSPTSLSLQERLDRLRSRRLREQGKDVHLASHVPPVTVRRSMSARTATSISGRVRGRLGKDRKALDEGVLESVDVHEPHIQTASWDVASPHRAQVLSGLSPMEGVQPMAGKDLEDGRICLENPRDRISRQQAVRSSHSSTESSNYRPAPLGLSRRASNSARSPSSRIELDTSNQKTPEAKALPSTSRALASLEASLARLGARTSRTDDLSSRPEPSSSRRHSATSTELSSKKALSSAMLNPSLPVMPPVLQRQRRDDVEDRRQPFNSNLDETTQHSERRTGSLKSGPSRHVQRLLQTEGGLDSAGNSPRKIAPSRVVTSAADETAGASSPSRIHGTFLERARAVRAAEAQKATGQRRSEESTSLQGPDEVTDALCEHDALPSRETLPMPRLVQKNNRRPERLPLASPVTSGVTRRIASPESDGDEAAIELQLTPNPAPQTEHRGHSESPSVRLSKRRPPQRSTTASLEVERCPDPSPAPSVAIPRTSDTEIAKRRDSSRCLKGVAVLVDVRDANGKDESNYWVQLLKSCGAKVASRCPSAESRRQLTHIVWKHGKPSTLSYFKGLARDAKPWVVGTQWVRRCVEGGLKVPEMEQVVELGREALWARVAKKHDFVRPSGPAVALESSLYQVSSLLKVPKRVGSSASFQEVFKAATQHLPEDPSPLRRATSAKELEEEGEGSRRLWEHNES